MTSLSILYKTELIKHIGKYNTRTLIEKGLVKVYKFNTRYAVSLPDDTTLTVNKAHDLVNKNIRGI